MKDIAHHRKHIQKKILKETKETMREERSPPPKEMRAERAPSRQNPEYEGERFDPHHRKPRLLKRINYH